MNIRRTPCLVAVAVLGMTALALPTEAEPQFPDMVKDAAEDAAKRELTRQVEELVANAVKCAFDNFDCIQGARERGEDIVLTDEDGQVMYDEEGQPITDPAQLPEDKRAGLGEVTTSYDFEPGDRVLFAEDFTGDNVGDFPRRLEFVKGNWEVVERQGGRSLRNTGPRHSAFKVPLPETLPERFTIEFEAHFPPGNLAVATVEPERSRVFFLQDQSYFHLGNHQAGVAVQGEGVESLQTVDDPFTRGMVPVRIMVDGAHTKVFVGRERVANVPNAVIPRSDVLWFENTYYASKDAPMYIENIRIAAGGRDLYEALETDGRVAVRNIHFDTNSADIRPESADVLEKIGTMLQEHPDLKLMIEGHTDDRGGFDHNMTLSADRAAAVRSWLVENLGIEPARLRTMGLGATQPVADNASAEGRQQNRRVELVRIEG